MKRADAAKTTRQASRTIAELVDAINAARVSPALPPGIMGRTVGLVLPLNLVADWLEGLELTPEEEAQAAAAGYLDAGARLASRTPAAELADDLSRLAADLHNYTETRYGHALAAIEDVRAALEQRLNEVAPPHLRGRVRSLESRHAELEATVDRRLTALEAFVGRIAALPIAEDIEEVRSSLADRLADLERTVREYVTTPMPEHGHRELEDRLDAVERLVAILDLAHRRRAVGLDVDPAPSPSAVLSVAPAPGPLEGLLEGLLERIRARRRSRR